MLDEVQGDLARVISGPVVAHSSIDGDVPASDVRTTFVDSRAQSEFDDAGYAVVPFLDAPTLARVRAVWERVGPAPGDERDGFFPGNASESLEWKRRVIAEVTPIVADAVAATFDRHHMFHLTFIVKWPGPDGKLQAHQDSTMVDREGSFRGVTAWCMLDPGSPDRQRDQGVIRIFRGSHRLPTAQWYRARGGWVPSGLHEIEDAVYERLAEPVITQLGDAIVFDHRVIHCSSPNLTDDVRPVLAIGLRPDDVGSLYIEGFEDGSAEFYEVDDDFFLEHPAVDMSRYPMVRRIQRDSPPTVRLEDLGVAPHAARGRLAALRKSWAGARRRARSRS